MRSDAAAAASIFPMCRKAIVSSGLRFSPLGLYVFGRAASKAREHAATAIGSPVTARAEREALRSGPCCEHSSHLPSPWQPWRALP